MSYTVKQLLENSNEHGEEHATWFKGISDKEHDVVSKTKTIKSSDVPIPHDNQVMSHLGYSDDEAENMQHDIKGEHHTNVTKDRENAHGYGKHVLWFHNKHLSNDYGGGYGTINVKHLDKKEFGKTWGISQRKIK